MESWVRAPSVPGHVAAIQRQAASLPLGRCLEDSIADSFQYFPHPYRFSDNIFIQPACYAAAQKGILDSVSSS